MHWYKSLPQSMSVPILTHMLNSHCRLLSLHESGFGLRVWLAVSSPALSDCLQQNHGQESLDIWSATRKVPRVSLSLDMDLRCLLCAHLDIQMKVISFPFNTCSFLFSAVVICALWQSLNHFFSYRFWKIFQQKKGVFSRRTLYEFIFLGLLFALYIPHLSV